MLEAFVLRAKAACYIGNGDPAKPSRKGAQDLCYAEGALTYRDSYFGGTDFVGQEVVWEGDTPVWAMNYYGRILRDDLLDAATGGMLIKTALSAMYAEGSFLGGWQFHLGDLQYTDENQGGFGSFHGREAILRGGVLAYRLDYHGGMIRP